MDQSFKHVRLVRYAHRFIIMSIVTFIYMPVHILRACAGAGKTSRIVNECEEVLITPGSRAVVITLTNSVRAEITDRLIRAMDSDHPTAELKHDIVGHHNTLQTTFETVYYCDSIVHIASADAFVHKALIATGYQIADSSILHHPASGRSIEADDFNGKRIALGDMLHDETDVSIVNAAIDAALGVSSACHSDPPLMKILIDEFQDLDDIMCNITATLACHLASRGGTAIAVGDPLQNVFGKATGCAIQQFEDAVEKMQTTDRNVVVYKEEMMGCYRCPQSHLTFVNRIFPEREMVCKKSDTGERPMLIAHDPDDMRAAAAAIANAMEEHITTRGLKLDDVAVLAPTTNRNALLSHLESELNLRFQTQCPPGQNAVKWFLTGDSQSGIDWNQAIGRIAMLSIHADKGRTHRLCVLCNASEGVLPRLGSSDSVQKSLLYVALTRSCESMMVSFGIGRIKKGMPRLFDPLPGEASGHICRYIRTEFDTLADMLALCDWSRHSLYTPDDIEWPTVQSYAMCPRSTGVVIPSTVSQWANIVPSPRFLVENFDPHCHRFGEDITNLSGMAAARNYSMEFAIGLLAQRRLQMAMGDCNVPKGWVHGGMEITESAALKKALQEAAQTVSQYNYPEDARKLWNVALVETAGVEDDVRNPRRPWALACAASLWENERTCTLELLEISRRIDDNAMHASQMLKNIGRQHNPIFEAEYRCHVPGHKALVSGRVDLILQESVIEIKASTMPNDNEGDSPPCSSWWNQVILYAGMMANTTESINTERVGIVDVTRGSAWWLPVSNSKQILHRATPFVVTV